MSIIYPEIAACIRDSREIERCGRDQHSQQPDSFIPETPESGGALNEALPALRRIRRAGAFSTTSSTLLQIEEFQRASDPLAQWLALATVASPESVTPQVRLHSAYALACLSV